MLYLDVFIKVYHLGQKLFGATYLCLCQFSCHFVFEMNVPTDGYVFRSGKKIVL